MDYLSAPLRLSRLAILSLMALVLCVPLLTAIPAGAAPAANPASTWHTNGVVWAVERVGDKVILGGEFTKLVAPDGRTMDRVNLAALNAATGEPLDWRADTDGPVLALAVKGDGSTVYVGGDFQKVKGVNRTRLAAVRASDAGLTSLDHAAAGRVRGLHVNAGRLYVAGEFTALGGLNRARVGAIDLASGSVVQSFAPTVQGGSVRDIDTSADSSRLYLAGTFTSVAAAPGTSYAAAVRTTDGSAIAWDAGVDQPLFDILAGGGGVYLAVGGVGWDNNRLQKHSASTGNELARYLADGDIQELELQGDVLYVGGHFVQLFGGVPRYQLAAIDVRDGDVLGFSPNIETKYGVWDMASGPEGLWIGGEFTRVGGTDRKGLALLPGNLSGAGNGEALVKRSDWWKFFDGGRAPASGTTWAGTGFDDGTWSTARPTLGYGPADVNRTTARVNTLYARRTFQVTDPAAFSGLEIRHLADDGAAIYLNGTEVVRDNLPAGALSYATNASSSRFSELDTYRYRKSDVPASRLRAGTNVIAVEIHNSSNDSDDLRFGLELVAPRTNTPAPPPPPPAAGITAPASCSTSVSGQSVTVSWSSVGSASSYIVFRNPDNTSDYRAGASTAPATSFVDNGVRTDATFTYKVVSVAADGSRSSKRTCSPNVRTTVGGGGISIPASCSIAVDGGAVTVNWANVALAEKYYVYRTVDGAAAAWAGRVDSPATTFRDTRVNVGPSYGYRVAAVDSRGVKSERRECSPASVRLDGPAPAPIVAPANCSISVSGSTVTATYAASNGAVRYTLFRNPDGAGDYWAGTDESTTIVDSGVRTGPTFVYKVIAIDGAGNRSSKRTCSPSVTISQTPPPPPPPPPASLAPPASCATEIVGGTDVRITWTGAAQAAEYKVYRNPGARDWVAGRSAGTSYLDAGVRRDVTLVYKVSTVGADGSESTLRRCTPDVSFDAPPPAPVGISQPASCSTTLSGNNITVNWSNVGNANKYYVYRSVNGAADAWVGKADAPSTSLVDANRSPGSYTHRVVAVDASGRKSAKTTCAPNSTIGAPNPVGISAPTTCSASVNGSSVALSWSGVNGADRYTVFRNINGGGDRWLDTENGTSVIDTSPPIGQSTIYKVVAVAANGTKSTKTLCGNPVVIANTDPCANLRVELFDDSNYGRSLGRFGVGSHALPLADQDRTSSIKVPLGLRLEAYDFEDFTGYLGFTTSNVAILNGANNDIEAIRVVCEL